MVDKLIDIQVIYDGINQENLVAIAYQMVFTHYAILPHFGLRSGLDRSFR